MQENANVVPFGKYKGQPVEVLQQDSQYLAWLMQQDWFKGRYPNIVQIVVNNFREPDESPEHNALQMKFMSDDFCEKVMCCAGNIRREFFAPSISMAWEFDGHRPLSVLLSEDPAYTGAEPTPKETTRVSFSAWGVGRKIQKRFEQGGVDVVCSISYFHDTYHWSENGSLLSNGLAAPDRWWAHKFAPYGVHRNDVSVYIADMDFNIEIKPSVGGDFPAIMRQMKANNKYGARPVLLAERFTCENVSIHDVKKFFANEGMAFLLVSDVDEFWAKSEQAMDEIGADMLREEQEAFYGGGKPKAFDQIVDDYRKSHE